MTLCNPVWRSARTHGRKLGFVLGFAATLLTLVPFGTLPAQAQNNSVYALRDTETEEERKTGWKWRVFSIGGVIGLAFGCIYILFPVLSGLIFTEPVRLMQPHGSSPK